jgi:hypothetical protein
MSDGLQLIAQSRLLSVQLVAQVHQLLQRLTDSGLTTLTAMP